MMVSSSLTRLQRQVRAFLSEDGVESVDDASVRPSTDFDARRECWGGSARLDLETPADDLDGYGDYKAGAPANELGERP